MAIILILVLQQLFPSSFDLLKEGEPVPVEFAVKYLNADSEFYGQYFKYETYLKNKFSSNDLPTLVYKEKSGVCNDDFLVIFDEEGTIISKLQISSQCDYDHGVAEHKSWSFQLNLDESIIYLDYDIETVKDKTKVDSNGNVIGVEDILDVERIKSKNIEAYRILTDGVIEQIDI
jgi:hypothetical protein